MLGVDRTYISMIESGRRKVTDRGALAYIARTLALPPHLLGITDPDNATCKAMLEFGASVIRLRQSLQLETDAARTGSGLVLLARAAAGSGQAGLFDTVTATCVRMLGRQAGPEVLFSTFTVREVRVRSNAAIAAELRGLLATGRARQAVDLAEITAADDEPPTPQWRVIERITTADVLAAAGEEGTAARILAASTSQAEEQAPRVPSPRHRDDRGRCAAL